MIDVLSYPRSGNHLVRYLIEYLTGSATAGCEGNPDDTFICHRKDVQLLSHINSQNIVTKKYHFASHIAAPSDKLIFILRSPLECCYSHGTPGVSTEALHTALKQYSKNVEYFHAFTNPKLFISYEELVHYNTEHTIFRLHMFLEALSNAARYEHLIANLDRFLDDARHSTLRHPISSSPCHYTNLLE